MRWVVFQSVVSDGSLRYNSIVTLLAVDVNRFAAVVQQDWFAIADEQRVTACRLRLEN
jgi:hypothetical protein